MKKNLQLADRAYSKRYLSQGKRSNNKGYSFQGYDNTQIANLITVKTLWGKPVLNVPRSLDLSKAGVNDEISQFFSVLETLLQEHPHIYLSFEDTQSVRLPMFLLIIATQEQYDAKISVIWSKDAPYVNRLIKESGAFLPKEERRKLLFDDNYNLIPVISGSNYEFNDLSDDLVDAINEKYYDGNIPIEIEAKISQAIIETLENVGRHAYPSEPNDEEKKWWLICSIGYNDSIDEEYMFLAIYDTGRGIPQSFEDSQVFQNRVKKHYPEEYKNLIRGDDIDTSKLAALKGLARSMKSLVTPFRDAIGDSGLIHASMMHDMTRIDDESHGQGSVSIKDLVTNDKDSKLIIFSSKGCYQYNKGSENEHIRHEYANELRGTLLQWSIKLDELY